MNRGKKPEWQKGLAMERIKILFDNADKNAYKPSISSRNILSAKKIAMRYNVKLSAKQKKSYCKNCMAYLKPGVSSSVSVSKKSRTVKCLNCGSIMRHLIRRRK